MEPDGIARRWMIYCLAAVAAVAATVTAVAAGAEQTYSRVFELERKQVPLPDGIWEFAGRAQDGDRVSTALVRRDGHNLKAGVLIQVSKNGAHPHWTDAEPCTRRDLPFARIRYQSDHDLSCAYVAMVSGRLRRDGVDPAWVMAQATAAEHDWIWPKQWGVVAIHVAQPQAAVKVWYAVALGTADAPTPATLTRWAETAWNGVEIGLHRQLGDRPALPDPITLRTAAETEPPPAPVEGFSLSRAVWKTITFRVIGTAIDFTTNLIASGSMATALSLSAIPIVVGPIIYISHELAWDYFGNTAERAAPMPGLGAAVPWPQPIIAAVASRP